MSLADLKDIIESVGSQILVVGTGLMVAYFKVKSQFDKKIQEVKTHTAISIQKLNGMLSYVINSFDRPAWIKVANVRADGEIEFRILDVNKVYCDEFGFSEEECIGKTDFEMGWDSISANSFRKHDLSVWASGETETFIEVVRGKSRFFRKLRVQSQDGMVKGVMGYEVDPPR